MFIPIALIILIIFCFCLNNKDSLSPSYSSSRTNDIVNTANEQPMVDSERTMNQDGEQNTEQPNINEDHFVLPVSENPDKIDESPQPVYEDVEKDKMNVPGNDLNNQPGQNNNLNVVSNYTIDNTIKESQLTGNPTL